MAQIDSLTFYLGLDVSYVDDKEQTGFDWGMTADSVNKPGSRLLGVICLSYSRGVKSADTIWVDEPRRILDLLSFVLINEDP